jgi:hypothetical protein
MATILLGTLGESRQEREASRTFHAIMAPFYGTYGSTPDLVARQSYARVVESRDRRRTGARLPD